MCYLYLTNSVGAVKGIEAFTFTSVNTTYRDTVDSSKQIHRDGEKVRGEVE